MADTATAATPSQKRKRPPTFQHLPINRAKKLKQSWVEVQKMKSKWKAQKRKEGLATARPPLPPFEDHHSADEDSENDGDRPTRSDSPKRSQPDGSNSSSEENDAEEEDESEEDGGDGDKEGENYSVDELPQRGAQSFRGRPPHKTRPAHNGRGSGARAGPSRKETEAKPAEETPSLRELQNQAYSRSSLHTFKANSSRKQGAPDGANSNRRGRGRGHAPTNGRGQARDRGRGQPDMRLRMNAMLEKIKRDMA